MGADASAFLMIGFPVTRDDFWTLREGVREDCANGHAQDDPTWIVCPKCGGKFNEPVTTARPTPNFERFCVSRGANPSQVINPDLTEINIRGFDFLDANAIQSSEDDLSDRSVVIGRELASIYAAGESPPHPIPADQIRNVIVEHKLLADALGLGDRPINLYPGVYWSV